MARGSRRGAHGRRERPGLDLGLALSVYGTNRRGELVELRDPRAHDPWPTEQ